MHAVLDIWLGESVSGCAQCPLTTLNYFYCKRSYITAFPPASPLKDKPVLIDSQALVQTIHADSHSCAYAYVVETLFS